LRVRAFAKINLSLRVLGVRAEGYHELRTVFQSIALHDTLSIARTDGGLSLSCDDPACPADADNLVWRAAERVWRAAGKRGAPHGVRIRLTKRIPIRAGLGGGSSDAAAALRALGALWRVKEADQREIGRQLGADVPYFFEGGTVLGLERGDVLFPLFDRPAAWVVLALPPFGVSTAEAFGWFDAAPRARRPARGTAARERSPVEEGRALNDLEGPVAARHPEIASLVRALKRSGAAQAAMSGSGSAVFGLFDRRADALQAARSLERRSRARLIVTRTIDRARYARLARK
jgi:4-diphosphocytidyl-2-C-methyl-D-erythritol kinase